MARFFLLHILLISALPFPARANEPCRLGLPQYQPTPISFSANASYVAKDGRIRIVGYNDMAEMLESLSRLFTAAHPDFRFELDLQGTRTGPPALTSRVSLFAPMGAEMEDDALAAYRAAIGSAPVAVRVAHTSLDPSARSSPVGIHVHPSNPLGALDLDQARRIFAPRGDEKPIRRWGELGLGGEWRDRPIHPIGFGARTAIGQFLLRHKFGADRFAADYTGRPQSREIVELVADDPLSIGLANLSHSSWRVRPLSIAARSGQPASGGSPTEIRDGRYPLDRHLLVYARREHDGNIDPVAREWINLILSCEGQQAIASGSLRYIPLNAEEVRRERLKIFPQEIEAGPPDDQ